MSNGAQVLVNIEKHWRSQLDKQMGEVVVPEWDVTIFFKPMNLSQQNRIFKYANEGSLESLVETLLIRALDADGKKLFSNSNKKFFMEKASPSLIADVVSAMNDAPDTTIEDARKNSEPATKKST
jgi:hypothetical protein